MGAVTALACWFAVRHGSLLTAVLGLVGGFATPLLLSTGEDHPFGLFGYVLLLDLALLFVGHRRRWPLLGLLAFLGTGFYQGAWILERMDERLWFGVAILGLFAVVFAVSGGVAQAKDRGRWLVSQATAVLFPFAFALYFAGQVEFGGHVYPTALLVGVLSAAACFIARVQRAPWLPAGAAAASVAVLGVWTFTTDLAADGATWELAGVACGLALVFHLFDEWEGWQRRADASRSTSGVHRAAPLAAAALLALVAVAFVQQLRLPLWPSLAGLVVLAGLLLRQGRAPGRGALALLAGGGVGAGLLLYHVTSAWNAHPEHDALVHAGLLLLLGASLLGVSAVPRAFGTARFERHAVGLLVLPALLTFGEGWAVEDRGYAFYGVSVLALALSPLVAGAALRTGLWHALTLLLVMGLVGSWVDSAVGRGSSDAELLAVLSLTVVTAATFTLWPTLWLGRFRGARLAWRAAGLAPLLFTVQAGFAWSARFGNDTDGIPLAAMGVLGALAAFAARARFLGAPADEQDDARGTAFHWHLGTALLLFALAVSVQLEREWFPVGCALFTGAAAWLHRVRGSRGVALLACLSGVIATGVLVAVSNTLGHFARSDARLWNELTYVHLVPAASLIVATALLARSKVPWWSPRGKRVGPEAVTGLCAIVVVFLWINVTILNATSTDPRLAYGFDRMPTRDLSTSIAWVLYALVLLGLGMKRRSSALRWTSLLLFLVTIAKVFLYDLGELEGLYRVASLAGLAVSLLLVSVLYQKVVFRSDASAGSGGSTDETRNPSQTS
jgi:uncharacterized membrane protein